MAFLCFRTSRCLWAHPWGPLEVYFCNWVCSFAVLVLAQWEWLHLGLLQVNCQGTCGHQWIMHCHTEVWNQAVYTKNFYSPLCLNCLACKEWCASGILIIYIYYLLLIIGKITCFKYSILVTSSVRLKNYFTHNGLALARLGLNC